MKKKTSPVQLYPRKDFLDRIASLTEGKITDYVTALLDARNQTELEALQNKISRSDLIERSIKTKEHTHERLSEVWKIWCETTGIYSTLLFDEEKAANLTAKNEFDKELDETTKKSKPAEDSLNNLLSTFFKNRFEKAENIEINFRKSKFQYLPAWPTVFCIPYISTITEEIQFNPFTDLEEYAKTLQDLLPKKNHKEETIKNTKIKNEILIDLSIEIAEKFSDTWINSKKSIIKLFKLKENKKNENSVDQIRQIFILTNITTQIKITNHAINKIKYEKITNLILNKNNADSDEQEVDNLETVPDAPFSNFLKLKIYQLQKIGIKRPAAHRMALSQTLLFFDSVFSSITEKKSEPLMPYSEALENLCSLSPFLTHGLRDGLAKKVVENGWDNGFIDNKSIYILAFCHQPFFKTKSKYIKHTSKILDTMGFIMNGVNKEIFLDVAEIYTNSNYHSSKNLSKDNYTNEILEATQQIINWYIKNPDQQNIPKKIQTLEDLAFLGKISNNPFHHLSYFNPFWALSNLLKINSFFLEDFDDSDHLALLTCNAFLRNGLIGGASIVFNFFVVTQTIRVITEYQQEGLAKKNINLSEVFCDWKLFHKVTTILVSSNLKNKTEKAIFFARNSLSSLDHEAFKLTIIELDSYLEDKFLEIENKESNVISLIETRSGLTRDRLVSLIGEKKWNLVPIIIQNHCIQIERIHDLSTGDEIISGMPTYAWLMAYNSMIEKMFKIRFSDLWKDPTINHELEKSYQHATRRNSELPKLGLGSALYVCKGAVESSNTKIISYLKNKGIDPHFITIYLFKDLIKAISIRNKGTHSDEISYEDAVAARKIFLSKLPDLVSALSINEKDYYA